MRPRHLAFIYDIFHIFSSVAKLRIILATLSVVFSAVSDFLHAGLLSTYLASLSQLFPFLVVRKGCLSCISLTIIPFPCSTKRVRSTTLLRPLFFLSVFSLSRNDRNRWGGYRRKICAVPTPFLCLPDTLEKMMGSNSGPCVPDCGHRYRWLSHSTI